jgi:DNA-binding CsgD family transcriptional regulator
MESVSERPPEPVEAWTERQRQVLDLIVKGRSNSEIAAELGISLDGVKWHMREILSKLNVDSRVEAAEYWRRRNGLPSRFARAWRAVAAISMGKAAAFAGVGVVLAGMVAVTLAVVMHGGSDGQQPAIATPLASSTPDPSASASPTSGAPAPTPPIGTTTLDINGTKIAARETYLTPSNDPGVLRNLSLVMTHGCWGCDEPDKQIVRTWWDNDGKQEDDVLFDAEQRGGSYLTRIASSVDGSQIVVGLCVRAYCGPLGGYQDASRVQLWRSDDYGTSWRLLTTFDGQAFPLGFTNDGLVVARTERAGAGFDSYLLELETGKRFEYPTGDAGNSPNAIPTRFGAGDEILWAYPDGTLHNLNGTPNFQPPPGRLEAALFGWGRIGASLTWTTPLYGGGGGALSLLSRLNEGGQLVDTWVLPTSTFWRPSWVAGTTMFVGSMTVAGEGQLPALVDVESGAVTIIRGPFESLAKQNDRNVVIAAQGGGALVRVNTPGDCLNLRDPQDPTRVQTCAGDGALLTLIPTDNSPTYHVVLGPYEAWVSPEFIEQAKAR